MPGPVWPIALFVAGLALLLYHLLFSHEVHPLLLPTKHSDFSFSIPIDISLRSALVLARHSWEFATAAHATLELHSPELSAYPSRQGFQRNDSGSERLPKLALSSVPALQYIAPLIHLNSSELQSSPATIGDPPALIPFALLLAESDHPSAAEYRNAAERQVASISKRAPRWANGAISHWRARPELWADFVHMTPPALMAWGLYVGKTEGIEMARDAVRQAGLYRAVLVVDSKSDPSTHPASSKGAWMHIISNGSENQDEGLWATSNGWAALGMLRMIALLVPQAGMEAEVSELKFFTNKILDAVLRIDEHDRADRDGDDARLLRNYLDDPSWFRECAGTAALSAAAYRYCLLFTEDANCGSDARYIAWADEKRQAVEQHIDSRTGVAAPVVWPLNHLDRRPVWSGSSEAQSFVVMMDAAWRDWCFKVGKC